MTKKTRSSNKIHKFIKQATVGQLKDLICAMYSPRCFNDCPLCDKVSCECEKIIME